MTEATSRSAIYPPATLGVLGGGQLGRMFTLAASQMGYRVAVLDPDPNSPAASVASYHIRADYDDNAALDELCQRCAAITTEFENVPSESLRHAAKTRPVSPSADAVERCQDRMREKAFLKEIEVATAAHRLVNSGDEAERGFLELGSSEAFLKRAQSGYDGKGQLRVSSAEEAEAGFAELGSHPCVLETRVPLAKELSVILARGIDGTMTLFPIVENRHDNGILALSLAPARIPEPIARRVRSSAERIAKALDYHGVLTVEFFLTPENELLVNEIAPRPHNSGHYTIDATVTSQFEQQVRMLCALPAGSQRQLAPAAMLNLLGDLWDRGEPEWSSILSRPEARLHLYGKQEPRPGRKMGHCTCLAASLNDAGRLAEQLHDELEAARMIVPSPLSGML